MPLIIAVEVVLLCHLGVEWKSPDNAYRIYKFYIDSKIITDNI